MVAEKNCSKRDKCVWRDLILRNDNWEKQNEAKFGPGNYCITEKMRKQGKDMRGGTRDETNVTTIYFATIIIEINTTWHSRSQSVVEYFLFTLQAQNAV